MVSRVFLAAAWFTACAVAAVPYEVTPPAFVPQKTALVTDVPMPAIQTEAAELRRRQLLEDEEEETDADPTPTTDTRRGDGTTTLISITPPSSDTGAPSALPSPFDTSLGASFTNGQTSCPNFINDMLEHEDFRRCYPVSLLLQGSRSFFDAASSLVSIVRVLDTACEADVEFCSEYLSDLAEQLLLDENCGSDYNKRNNVVVQAYMGLVAYETLYSATCLRNPETSQYCYASAVTNLTTASNVYFYYLPLNISLPGGATPTCNWCLEETMNIFQAATANREWWIASNYEAAAQQVNTVCGPEYVNETLPEPKEDSMAGTFNPSWTLSFAAILAVAVWNFV